MRVPASTVFRFVGWILACLMSSACTTTYRAEEIEGRYLAARLKVGVYVTCKMRNGTSRSFHVTEIRSDWLVGKAPGGGEQGVCLRDVARIKIQRGNRDDDVEFVLLLTAFGTAASAGSPTPVPLFPPRPPVRAP